MERMKFMMMMDWEKIRDNRGFYYYEGYDGNKKVVDIFPNDHYNKKWRVRILDRAQELTIRRTERKIGRNEPCPCGSGKKYKKCCIGK